LLPVIGDEKGKRRTSSLFFERRPSQRKSPVLGKLLLHREGELAASGKRKTTKKESCQEKPPSEGKEEVVLLLRKVILTSDFHSFLSKGSVFRKKTRTYGFFRGSTRSFSGIRKSKPFEPLTGVEEKGSSILI